MSTMVQIYSLVDDRCEGTFRIRDATKIFNTPTGVSQTNTGAVPITTSTFKDKVSTLLQFRRSHRGSREASILLLPPFRPEDVFLTPEIGPRTSLAISSFWIDICSSDPLIAEISELVLLHELSFAAFCGAQHVLVRSPCFESGPRCIGQLERFSKVVQKALRIDSSFVISITVSVPHGADEGIFPLRSLVTLRSETQKNARTISDAHHSEKIEWEEPWRAWDEIRSFCQYNSRLVVGLVIGKPLPPLEFQRRWLSEPIRCVLLGEGMFENVGRDRVVLEDGHESFVGELTRWSACSDVMIYGQRPDLSTTTGDVDQEDQSRAINPSSQPFKRSHQAYVDYFTGLQRRQTPCTVVETYAVKSGYDDTLHRTSRPATDILKNSTYKFFEGDPVKYDLYETAIRRALEDWVNQGKPSGGQNGAVVLAVLGAGRGPLVTRALSASEAQGVPIEIWAVERNPNAVYVLYRRNESEWNHRVNIVHGDIRSWIGPRAGRIDIIVSEMLGDFGDNELAPECLDGALHLLAPWGVSIPQSFTTFVTPVSAPKIHSELRVGHDINSIAFSTPCWTWLRQFDYISILEVLNTSTDTKNDNRSMVQNGENCIPRLPGLKPTILPVWQFSHDPTPKPNAALRNSHNSRRGELTFDVRSAGVCHGLAGYFECVLYPGVELSTNPNTIETKSPALTSWLTMFFPLKAGVYVDRGSKLDVVMERKTDGQQVWYEWQLACTWPVNGHELQFFPKKMGASDLHTSRAVAYDIME